MKGIKDITDGPRTHKEMIDDYVRLTLNRVNPDDEGTYCILVKNCYGCDRSFFTLKVNMLFKNRRASIRPHLSLKPALSVSSAGKTKGKVADAHLGAAEPDGPPVGHTRQGAADLSEA